jgi:hypothetical protein
MNDIKEIWESFIKKVSGNKNLKDLIEKLKNGKATYEDAQKYSSSFANYLVSYLASENPTDAEQVLEILRNTNICKNFFNEVDDYTYSMQKALNEANQIALNAVKVVSPRQLIDSNLLLSNDYEKDIENMSNKVELSANKHIDTVQQANAKFQSQVGYGVTVSRTYDGKGLSDGRTCKWCLERVGSNIPYDEAYKKGMFQRHEGCHCVIEYNNSGERSYQSSSGGRESWIDYDKKRVDKATLQEYSSTPTKELRTMWARGVDEGWISALVSFDSYSNAYTTLKNELVGERTSDGIVMREISEHFMQRVCGTSRDPKIYKEQHRIVRRDGCEPADIIDALLNGTSRPTIIKNGRVSKSYFNNECLVTINPETGMLIQCNRYN